MNLISYLIIEMDFFWYMFKFYLSYLYVNINQCINIFIHYKMNTIKEENKILIVLTQLIFYLIYFIYFCSRQELLIFQVYWKQTYL